MVGKGQVTGAQIVVQVGRILPERGDVRREEIGPVIVERVQEEVEGRGGDLVAAGLLSPDTPVPR